MPCNLMSKAIIEDLKLNKIRFNEDDVDHNWDTPRFLKEHGVWLVSGLQGYTMDVLVKADTEEAAIEAADDLYGEQA